MGFFKESLWKQTLGSDIQMELMIKAGLRNFSAEPDVHISILAWSFQPQALFLKATLS